MHYNNIIFENIIKEEINKAFKKILQESVTKEELERLFPDDVKIHITQELAEQMLDYAINNITEDFFHIERPKIYVTKIPSVGAFSFERPITYNRYTREIKNGYGSNATKADLYELRPVIRLNNSVKATKKSWFNTVCHELCHMISIFRTCTNPVRAHGKEFKYEASEFYNRTYGYINVTTYVESGEIEYSQEKQDKNRQKVEKESKKLNYYVNVIESPAKSFELYRLANENILLEYIKLIKTNYFRDMYEGKLCTFYHIASEELSKKLYDTGYKQTSRTIKFWTMNEDPELRNEIISHLTDTDYMEKIYTFDNRWVEINESDDLSADAEHSGIVTIPANTPLSGEFM